jgi:hypothetical protein
MLINLVIMIVTNYDLTASSKTVILTNFFFIKCF